MMPLNAAPSPIGMVMATGASLDFSLMSASAPENDARSSSSLFTNTILGLARLSRLRHSLMVSICMPARASTRMRADSHDRNARITSPIKSEEPGVSIKLILLVPMLACASEACTEILRSISSSA
jgi:hypothetical protein